MVDTQKVDNIIEQIGIEEDKLLPVLLNVQKICENNYISKEMLMHIASKFKIPFSKVYGVATFYSIIHLKPQPKYIIEICNNAPCHINGAQNIIDTFKSLLNIDMGEDTDDGIFGLRYVNCFGCCDLAPVAKINGEIKPNLTIAKVSRIINDLRRQYNENNQ